MIKMTRANEGYALKYSWNVEYESAPYSPSDITGEYQGLCDAMVVVSILRQPDGSYSQFIMSADGETKKELMQEDLFKVWMMMGLMLKDNKGLKGWRKKIIDIFAQWIRELYKSGG